MRNLLQIFMVVLFQSIACYLAGWLVTEVVFIGATVLLRIFMKGDHSITSIEIG